MPLNDEDVQQNVLDELSFDPRVDAANVGVAVHDGAVELTGHVPSYAEKYAAEQAVRLVEGVRAFTSRITVRLPSDLSYDDSDIAERVAHVLDSNVSIPPGSVVARVKDGIVQLTGEVDWQFQRKNLEAHVAHVRGVWDVVNEVKLRADVKPDNVLESIQRALHRSADVEANRIRVKTHGHEVELEGTVRAYREREMIERAAWSVPGVTSVIDRIVVA